MMSDETDPPPPQVDAPKPPTSGSKPKGWQPPTTAELQAMLPEYEITMMLGRGGMGAVYKGVQKNLERPVAIKILPPDFDEQDTSHAERFKNEARAMAKLNHPGIVKVFDFGQTRDGMHYIVMEFIEGTDVSRMIARKSRLAAIHALAITAHVCDALNYAHERGIIHRDIKPANIMVGYDGVVKVADFGLAKMSEAAHSGLTRSGMAMGTLHYMAPEALTLGSAVDHRADIYAVGVMFYHMLAGRLPQGIFEPLHQQFPELDPRYDDIVARAMRDDRELRYPSAAALRADLDGLLTQPVRQVQAPEQPPAALPTEERPQRPAPPPPEEHSAWHPQAAAAPAPRSGVNWLPWVALLIIGGAIAWLLSTPAEPGTDEQAPETAITTPAPPFTNRLGMKFVSVPGTDVQFCVHETRRQDYATYAAEVPGVDPTWNKAQHYGVPCGDQDNHPVVSVSWEDAQGFCVWLSKKEGRVFRLPTDAEWSMAVGLPEEDRDKTPEERGAQNRGFYPWGKTWPPPPKTGNFADTSMVGNVPRITEHIAGYTDGFMTTCRVMTYPPNAFGIHDLEGNVSEWTADWFNEKQERRAVRGGAWGSAQPGHLLAARRSSTAPSLRYPYYGFRVVVEPPGKIQPLAETTPKAPADPPSAAFTNSLGMKFVPVPGTQTLFCIHETRRQDYEACAKENSAVDSGWKSTFGLKPDELPMLPVHGRSWHDAKAFCDWLSRKEGITYRLPTDREWSYAVGVADMEDPKATPESLRQKVKTHFPWGTEWPPPKDAGNYGHVGTKADFEREIPYLTPDPHPIIAPVMSYRPNPLGIYDLGGNVGEWCEDGWDEAKTRRVLRGGMWTSYSPGYRLSSDRMNHAPDTRFAYWSFRVIAESAAPFPAKPLVFPSKPLPAPVTNSLDMRFVPVPGTDILMCVHETRRRDYAPYHATVPGVDQAWKSTDIYGVAFKEDDNLPVMRVSWEDAMLYSDWLSKKEGRVYRLPTDREWSHAVGIGADEAPFMTPSELNGKITGVYPWGSQWPPPAGAGNYADDEANTRSLLPNSKLDIKGIVEGYKDGFATISPVMSLKPNALGFYDLGGNVQEWCVDFFDDKADRQVTRGACWNRHEPERLLSSRRDRNVFDARGVSIGFRLVLVPDATPPKPPPLTLPNQTAFTNTLGMKFVPVPGTDICMCVHETRMGDFAKFAAENSSVDPGWKFTIVAGRPDNQGDDFAVGGMSWNDATAFCAWLSKKEGRTYRLPTDREWSCAVGIGQEEPPGFSASVLKNRLPGVYLWGKEWPPKSPVENFADTASKAKFPPGNNIGLDAFIEGYTDGFPTTARVMSFPPNALGIYDLGGNVREWCADHGNSATTGHVMRGGCWKSSDHNDTVSAFRLIREPDKRSSEYGFRIVAEPLPAPAPPAPASNAKVSPTASDKMQSAKTPPASSQPASSAPVELGIVAKAFDAITLDDIVRAKSLLKNDRIDASDGSVVKVGTVLIYQTSEGRLGKARVEAPAYSENNEWLTLSWCTFTADNQIHSSGKSLVITRLAAFDLDSGKLSMDGADFRWGFQAAGKPYLATNESTLIATLPPGAATSEKTLPAPATPVPAVSPSPAMPAVPAATAPQPALPLIPELSVPVSSDPKLKALAQQFRDAITQQVTPVVLAHAKMLLTSYRNAIDRAALTVGVSSADAAALRAELQRFTTDATVPDADAPGTPQVVSSMRSTYREALRAFQNEKIAPLKKIHDEQVRSLVFGPLLAATKDQPFVNSLGMKFIRVPGTEVLFCMHETRHQDYAVYAAAVKGVGSEWQNQTLDGFAISTQAGEHPVVSVCWDDARKFCQWLSQSEKKTYRLPTDLEWSAAVGIADREIRTPQTTPAILQGLLRDEYPWGKQWPPPKGAGNLSDQSRKKSAPPDIGGNSDSLYITGYDDGFPTTSPVMSFKPNWLGLFDLEGNAREWCEDWYDAAQTQRVVRGGGWNVPNTPSSNRMRAPPGIRRSQFGFRCVLEMPAEASQKASR